MWSPPSTLRPRQLKMTQLTSAKSPSMPIEGLRETLFAHRLRMNVELCPPIVLPNAWLNVLRHSLKIEFWIVMLTVGSFFAGVFGSLSLSYMWRYIDMFSSSPHEAETWSIMMLPVGLPPI